VVRSCSHIRNHFLFQELITRGSSKCYQCEGYYYRFDFHSLHWLKAHVNTTQPHLCRRHIASLYLVHRFRIPYLVLRPCKQVLSCHIETEVGHTQALRNTSREVVTERDVTKLHESTLAITKCFASLRELLVLVGTRIGIRWIVDRPVVNI